MVRIDGRLLGHSSHLDADVVVVGSGPAGWAVASEVSRAGRSVLVLESGGVRADETADDRAEVDLRTTAQYGVSGTRRIQLGGLANDWEVRLPGHDEGTASGDGVRHLPLDEVDLEPRGPGGSEGWPLTMADLRPWYAAAHAALHVPDDGYDLPPDGADGLRPLPLDPSVVRTRVFRFSRGEDLLDDLDALTRRQDVTVVTHAHVTRLLPGGRGDVGGMEVACGERRWTARGSAYVLAAGGIENPRLLLTSADHSGAAIGDVHGQVGRCFMDHPQVRGGVLVPRDRAGIRGWGAYDLRWDGGYVLAKLDLAPDLVRREGLVNMSAILLPRPAYAGKRGSLQWRGRDESSLARRAASGLVFLRHPRSVLATRAGLREGAFPDVSRDTGWSRPDRVDLVGAFEVFHQTEQRPHPDNRVTLSDQRDEFGMRRARLDYRWRDEDARDVQRGIEVFASELARAGVGTYHLDHAQGGRPRMMGGTHHHLGTTRMSSRPRDGVVNPDGRVHGVDNLYVAGSSVFPSGGYANPTLTIVALALRLGFHLGRVVRR